VSLIEHLLSWNKPCTPIPENPLGHSIVDFNRGMALDILRAKVETLFNDDVAVSLPFKTRFDNNRVLADFMNASAFNLHNVSSWGFRPLKLHMVQDTPVFRGRFLIVQQNKVKQSTDMEERRLAIKRVVEEKPELFHMSQIIPISRYLNTVDTIRSSIAGTRWHLGEEGTPDLIDVKIEQYPNTGALILLLEEDN
jgi:hypothetical protein